MEWSAYYLSWRALLEVLEYLSVLSVLFAVIFYFAETGDRRRQKHYQARQVVNTAQGKGLRREHSCKASNWRIADLFRANLEAAD